MMEFSADEINNLIEAVSAWEKVDSLDSFNSLLLTAMFASNKDECKGELEKLEAEQNKKMESAKIKKENCILLKAKLITMRDRIEAREFGASIQ